MKKYIMKLQRAGSHSYMITIPKELIRKFKWREHQKLEISFGGRSPELKIKDWKK